MAFPTYKAIKNLFTNELGVNEQTLRAMIKEAVQELCAEQLRDAVAQARQDVRDRIMADLRNTSYYAEPIKKALIESILSQFEIKITPKEQT